MSDFLLLGTDTDAGKTTFALLWMTCFADDYAYWKPVETGPSDSQTLRDLVAPAYIHPPGFRLETPVAPPLAARLEAKTIPSAHDLAALRPVSNKSLLIETFGGPFSPLNEHELQIDLIRRFDMPTVLVGTSTIGAVGRTLATVKALGANDVWPRAVVLLGPEDRWAEGEIRRHANVTVFGLRPPPTWSSAGLRQAVDEQRGVLQSLRNVLASATLADSRSQVPSENGTLGQQTAWLDADRRCVWHPYTPLCGAEEPLAVVGANAEFLQLADGRTIIDGISSWWTIQHGHRHPPLMKALAEASQQIDHVIFAGATHPWGALLAEQLLATVPWNGGRVFFSENGSTAVEVALKMAYQFWCHRGEPQRTTFIGFENSYHGDTFGAMAISRDPVFFARFEPLLFKTAILPVDPDRLDAYLSAHPGEVAGVIIEPLVQAAGGMVFHSETTLRNLFEVAKRHAVLFIADEVMTGLGRTGTFWAHEAAEIQPDLIATAKTLAGGVLPLAATLASPEIVAVFDTDDRRQTFFHGHSFTAHPLACAVALANFPLILAAVPETPRRYETFWRAALAEFVGAPGVREVRCRGTLAVIDLDVHGGYLADTGRAMRQAALQCGVLLRPLGNVLYALPPWETSTGSLEKIVVALRSAVEAASTRGGP